MSPEVEVFFEGLRVIFIIIGPLLLGMLLVGFLSGVLQTALGVKDLSFSFSLKALCLILIIYFLAPLCISLLQSLGESVFV